MHETLKTRSPNFGVLALLLLALFSLALTLALLLTAPWWLGKLERGGKYREGLRERLGQIPRARLHPPANGQTVLWLHAVSVGEVLAAAPLVHALRAALPGTHIYVSTTTRTGQAIARNRFGSDSVFYFPADFAFAVRAWLRFLQPSLLVLVESEFWPRFLYEADRANIPVAVVNARISPRSWPRYRRLRVLWRPLLRSLALVHAQSPLDAERLRALGAPGVTIGGNLKYDVQPPRTTPLLAILRAALPPAAPLLVCGSTLDGEEAALLHSLPKDLTVLLAPRHPERFAAVAELLASGPRSWLSLSAWRETRQPIVPGTVLLLDSVGELAALYALATVAVVGGGLLHPGGHNPLEPAALSKPTVIGPNAENFAGIVQKLHEANAILIAESPDLWPHIEYLLLHPQEAAAMGERARLVCAQEAGATARALAALLPLVRP